MATDYDASRKSDEEQQAESLETLQMQRRDEDSGKVDQDETEASDAFELPGADLSHLDFTVEVTPRQADEITCARCFLVLHRSRFPGSVLLDGAICDDCS